MTRVPVNFWLSTTELDVTVNGSPLPSEQVAAVWVLLRDSGFHGAVTATFTTDLEPTTADLAAWILDVLRDMDRPELPRPDICTGTYLKELLP
jgi:hypothetical protein